MHEQQRRAAAFGRLCGWIAYVGIGVGSLVAVWSLTEGLQSFVVSALGAVAGVASFYGAAVILRAQEQRSAARTGRRLWTSGPLLDVDSTAERGRTAATVLMVATTLFVLTTLVVGIQTQQAVAEFVGGGVDFGFVAILAVQSLVVGVLLAAFATAVRGAADELANPTTVASSNPTTVASSGPPPEAMPLLAALDDADGDIGEASGGDPDGVSELLESLANRGLVDIIDWDTARVTDMGRDVLEGGTSVIPAQIDVDFDDGVWLTELPGGAVVVWDDEALEVAHDGQVHSAPLSDSAMVSSGGGIAQQWLVVEDRDTRETLDLPGASEQEAVAIVQAITASRATGHAAADTTTHSGSNMRANDEL